MNRIIFVLLTVASLASVLNMARAETMEERKQRIMRKYMRERQDIMQSDFGVPEAFSEEDARVVESEQFKDISAEFERHTGGVGPPPMARPALVQQEEQSWWLETADMEEDPFADPFSSKKDRDEESAESWLPWDRQEDSSAYDGGYGRQRDRLDDSYPGRREDSSDYDDASSRQWGELGAGYPDRSSAYGTQSTFGDRSSESGMSYGDYTTGRDRTPRASDQAPGYYGEQLDARGAGYGWQLDSGRRYDTAPSTGWPQSSLPSPADRQSWSSQNQTPAYTPYRSPYQTQDEEQRRYGDNFEPQQPQYSRPDNYQKWKDSNKTWNPSSGNAYLDELMRNERR